MKLRVGDQVQVDGVDNVVCALTTEWLAIRCCETGTTKEILISDFIQSDSVKASDQIHSRAAETDLVTLHYLPDDKRQEVEYLSNHIRQLLRSFEQARDSKSSIQTLTAAKHADLQAAGYPLSLRSFRRQIKTFREHGAAGLIDGRKNQDINARRRIDDRIVPALAEVMAAQTKTSTGTRLRLIELTAQLLDERHGPRTVPLPSNSTFFRIIADLDKGRSTTGSAKTRRSLANRPDRAFTAMTVSRPGEQVQIDSTSLDVQIQLDGGLVDRPDLTIMLDVATRSIISGVVRPGSTKSVDLIVALARALVPHAARPGGRAETRALVEHAFDQRSLMEDQDLDAYRRRQPYIFPETITTDRGKIYISEHFTNACEQLGISLNLSASYTPTDKAKVERTFQSINTGFTQYLKNYTGRGVEYRGTDLEPETLHSLVELQELLDEWIAVVWQNRPHDSLRDPLHPSRALTPNEMFRAYREIAPEIEIPFDTNTYISLLPVRWRTLQAYGITIDHRVYDSSALNHLRRTRSTYPGQTGKWPIHVDPYNVQTVWIPVDDEWIPLEWAHGSAVGPMSADVWNVTRRSGFFAERKALEFDIAERSRDILTRAGQGRSRESIAAARSRTVSADTMRLSELTHATPPVVPPTDHETADDREPLKPLRRFELVNMADEVERRL